MINIIVLAGMPASGKSTVASRLKKEFALPVLEKDALKEEIFDTMGFDSYAVKRKCDHAANAVLLRCARALLENGQSMILDNNFDTASAERLELLAREFGAHCITVFFGGDTEAFYRRYVERDRLHLRHLGHVLQEHYPPREGDSLDYTMTREEFHEKFFKRGMAAFTCPGERIEIDTTDLARVDVPSIVAKVCELLS